MVHLSIESKSSCYSNLTIAKLAAMIEKRVKSNKLSKLICWIMKIICQLRVIQVTKYFREKFAVFYLSTKWYPPINSGLNFPELANEFNSPNEASTISRIHNLVRFIAWMSISLKLELVKNSRLFATFLNAENCFIRKVQVINGSFGKNSLRTVGRPWINSHCCFWVPNWKSLTGNW